MIKAEIVAHSLSPQGDELMSVLCTFPRIILSEVNTHRMLSKNTSSSRAIPFFKMVDSVINNPFVPIAWQTHHKGMQGTEYIAADRVIGKDMFFYDFIKLLERQAEEDNIKLSVEFYKTMNSIKYSFHALLGDQEYTVEQLWLKIRDVVVMSACMLYAVAKVSKQICNRLLEPFMWTTMLITGPALGGGWDNFYWLRLPKYEVTDLENKVINFVSRKEFINSEDGGLLEVDDISEVAWLQLNKGAAEIHMMALAEAIYDVHKASVPTQLYAGDWHIPFRDKITANNRLGEGIDGFIGRAGEKFENGEYNKLYLDALIKTSVGMAAQTSYTIIDNEKVINYNNLVKLAERLEKQTPAHSSPMEHVAKAMNEDEYKSWNKGSLDSVQRTANWKDFYPTEQSIGWCRNYRGFIPYRHIVENKTNG